MELKYNTEEEPKPRFHRIDEKMAHYSTPTGYIEGLHQQIMAKVESRSPKESEPSTPTSLWTKLKPSLYLAASFVGLLLSFQAFLYIQETIQNKDDASIAQDNSREVESTDGYANYYEDYMARVVANDIEHTIEDTQYL